MTEPRADAVSDERGAFRPTASSGNRFSVKNLAISYFEARVLSDRFGGMHTGVYCGRSGKEFNRPSSGAQANPEIQSFGVCDGLFLEAVDRFECITSGQEACAGKSFESG